MRRPIPELCDFHYLQNVLNSVFNILWWNIKLQGPKGDLLVDRRREELNIRVLKDEAHLRAEIGPELIILYGIKNILGYLIIEGIKFS